MLAYAPLSWPTDDIIKAQREKYGDNLIVESRRRSWKQRIKETAADPMLLFLLVTSLVYFVLGDAAEAIVLLVAVLPLTGMDAFLHHRTQASTAGPSFDSVGSLHRMRKAISSSL